MSTPEHPEPAAHRTADPPAGVRTMAVVRWALVGLMALISAGSVLSYGLSSSWLRSARPGDTAEKLYYCPMHPQIVQDHPGQCPICSMTLVLKPPAAAPATAAAPAPAAGVPPGLVTIDLPLDRVQRIGVRTETVTLKSRLGDVRTVGTVEPDERGLARISPRFSGWIEHLQVSETGQQVRKGQTLATIYSPEVLQAQQELLTALGWSASPGAPSALPHHGDTAPLEGLVADARHRLELLGISPQEIDAIASSRKPQRAIAIRSPVSGYVIAKNAVLGMAVSPGAPLFEVADLSTVWVLAEVYESDLARVRIGQPARFAPSALSGEVFSGKVKFVYPTLDPASRTLRVRLELRNRAGAGGLRLRPGMYGTVMLDLPATSGLMVAAEAVVDTGDMQYVFVAREGGRFEPRRVKVGARLGDQVEILDGVREGERLVTTANFLIDSESRLRAAIEGPAAPATATSAPASSCDREFDARKYPDKYRACRSCEVQHRGMGSMEDDCKNAIAKPWR